MTQPAPPDPLLVEIRDLLIEIRDAVKPRTVEVTQMPIVRPAESRPPKRPPPARSGIG